MPDNARCYFCDLRIHSIVGFVEYTAKGDLDLAERYLRVAMAALEGLSPQEVDRVFQSYEAHVRTLSSKQ